jgi:DNA-directed RNA polymerase specialized sigma24 family protein
VSRFVEIEPLLPVLRRFVHALVPRRGETNEIGLARADAIIHRSVNSALNEAANCDGERLRVLLFAAAVQHHRAQSRRETIDETQDVAKDTVLRGQHFIDAAGAPAQREARAVHGALAQMPRELREVLLLVVLGELSYVQAAEALDLSLSDTFARLTRARTAFAALLEGHEREGHKGLVRAVAGQGTPIDASPADKAARRSAVRHLRIVK